MKLTPGDIDAPAAGLRARYPRWSVPDDEAPLEATVFRGMHPVLARLLHRRGVRSPEDLSRFLSPALDHLHDPYDMRGMGEAVSRIQQAIRQGESILIYGDYDVDGTTAVVLLRTALERLGGKVQHHIPHRLRDGYGMRPHTLGEAARSGVRLVISVDTGIRAYAAAEEAASAGMDLIVTDHHLPEADRELPQAVAVLNPNRHDCDYPGKHLCGAGVAFKLAQALLEAHDRETARGKLLPSFLRILAIATVADAVPLVGENRVIASLGIRSLPESVNPGLRALMKLAEIPQPGRPLTAGEIAFRLAPRINAAGRMDIASDVVELLLTRDPARAQELAEKLHRLNQDRRDAEAAALREIEVRLASDSLAGASCVVLDGEGWHRGVLGILASRVVERAGRPALVMTHQDGEAAGSGRSIPGSICWRHWKAAAISSPALAAMPTRSAFRCPRGGCPSCASAWCATPPAR